MAGQEKPKVPELEKWYFTKEQLQNSPSRRCGLDADKELAYRQQAANLIQDMGQRLQVSQLCINTAIVYMHRFYAFHSFTQFHRNAIAAAALFLAAKVEEQPRKLEYVIKVAHVCLHRGENVAALTTEQYQEQAQDLVFNENVLLQTLGFDVAIDHPHTHVVRTCHLVKAPKDLAQTSYFMASNSLHLTTMCLQYRPTVVACFCIHLASKWSNWAIPQSSEGRHWFSYVDRSVTCDLLEKLTAEFLHIFDKCPSRLKKKMMTIKGNGSPHSGASHSNQSSSSQAASPFDKKHVLPTCDDFDKAFDREYERERERRKANIPGGYVPATNPAPTQPPPQKIDYNVYREKKEREERERREERARQLQRPQPHPKPPQPPHARPTGQHKPAPWPHHKPHDHKVHHKSHSDYKIDHRHHRPIPGPSASATSSTVSAPAAPNPTPSGFPPVEQVPTRTRPPSLFSPENATTPTAAAVSKRPQQTVHRPRQEVRPQPPIVPIDKPLSPKRRPESNSTNSTNSVVKDIQPPTILSPFTSPPVREQLIKPRQRAPSSSSEPELVPVVKKIDETPGFENVIRDAQRGSIKTRPEQKRKESPPVRPLNGIETDPTLVSNLLKESLAKPAPITVQTEKEPPIIERDIKKELPPQPIEIAPPKLETPNQPIEETEHKHKKDKKKKDKHKHRDKSKEERKKHKKDKDKERKQETAPAPVVPAPLPPPPPEPINDGTLRITIPREKLATSPGLKIKIPKDRLAAPPPPPPHASGLKIKISKDVLDTSRKRSNPMDVGPPQKMSRQNGAPHHKVSNWRQPAPYRPPMPYFMVQPPPQMFYGMGNPMDGFYYGPPMYPQMQHMHNGQPMANVHNAHPMSNVHNAHNGSMSNVHNGPQNMHNGPPSMHNGPPSMHNGPPSMHNGPPSMHNGPPPMGNVHNGPPPLPPAHNGHRNHGLPPPLPDMPPPPVPPPPPE